MKIWLTRYKRQFLALGIMTIMGVVFFLGWYAGINAANRKAYDALWEAFIDLPDPERCALCGEGMRYHAPCLLDLSTGQMGEMQVYTYDPTPQGKMDPREAQFSGTFSLQRCAGLTAIRNADSHTCRVFLPEGRELMNPAHFCKECRLFLARAGLEGYVIVDLHDLDHKLAYPVRAGEYEVIRDYQVSVERRREVGSTVIVEGILPD